MTITQFLAMVEEPKIEIVPPPNLPDSSNTQAIMQSIQNQVTNNNLIHSNDSLIGKLEALRDSVMQLGSDVGKIVNGVGKVIYYLTHPKILAWIIWGGLVKYSFWICLFICLLSTIAFIIGWKKGKKYAIGSFLVYTIIEMFNAALH